jgi:hypothetical protein
MNSDFESPEPVVPFVFVVVEMPTVDLFPLTILDRNDDDELE